jgi:hypothetical protein
MLPGELSSQARAVIMARTNALLDRAAAEPETDSDV